MKKFKLLILTTINIGLLSSLCFAKEKEVPITVSANIVELAPQYTLKIDGVQGDSLKFDLGNVGIGESKMKVSNVKIFKGEEEVNYDNVRVYLEKSNLSNNTADTTVVAMRSGNGYKVGARVIGKSSGKFSGTTKLTII